MQSNTKSLDITKLRVNDKQRKGKDEYSFIIADTK